MLITALVVVRVVVDLDASLRATDAGVVVQEDAVQVVQDALAAQDAVLVV